MADTKKELLIGNKEEVEKSLSELEAGNVYSYLYLADMEKTKEGALAAVAIVLEYRKENYLTTREVSHRMDYHYGIFSDRNEALIYMTDGCTRLLDVCFANDPGNPFPHLMMIHAVDTTNDIDAVVNKIKYIADVKGVTESTLMKNHVYDVNKGILYSVHKQVMPITDTDVPNYLGMLCDDTYNWNVDDKGTIDEEEISKESAVS